MLPHQRLRIAATLCATAVLAACHTPAGHEAPSASRAAADANRKADGPATASRSQPVDISPAQALSPQALGTHVRWSGGINAIDAREGGRQCFTMLHATSDARGVLQWLRDAQQFVACGAGGYDRNLVAPFTLLSLEGRVTGQEVLLGKPVPVIEIEALYRHTDCVQGSEQSPECYSGYLQPGKP